MREHNQLCGLLLAAVVATAAWSFTKIAAADMPKLMTESALIPSADAGIQLYLREKRPADMTAFSSDRVLLFVHGATYPAETTFDLPLGGHGNRGSGCRLRCRPHNAKTGRA